MLDIGYWSYSSLSPKTGHGDYRGVPRKGTPRGTFLPPVFPQASQEKKVPLPARIPANFQRTRYLDQMQARQQTITSFFGGATRASPFARVAGGELLQCPHCHSRLEQRSCGMCHHSQRGSDQFTWIHPVIPGKCNFWAAPRSREVRRGGIPVSLVEFWVFLGF